jgi:hypothetical protein
LLPASFSVGLAAAALRFTTVAVTASGSHFSDYEFVFMSGTRVAGYLPLEWVAPHEVGAEGKPFPAKHIRTFLKKGLGNL